MSSPRSDAELLAAHAGGDPDAFGELVRRHQPRLWSVALGTLRDPDEAADALQDALISAYRAAAGYRGDAAVTTWLHRIVVNACLDRLRRRRVRPTVQLPEQGPGEPVEPRDRLAEHDTAVVVREALAQLGEDHRAAITLVDLHGYPVAEAAEILGVPQGTVKSRCARGRLQLAVMLGHLRAGAPASGGQANDEGNSAPTSDVQAQSGRNEEGGR
ncbi:MAG: RNA polymerase sigma factor SigM [Geodermatophilaceae bacterium]|jgi:RNA polymerase sigma-70 factor (ECF subfamily)|nr:RNA polymerase sigma factor SigM [Geodermatophilaceae bacterium]MDQ3464111.1 RNA polymerase sigma factor SigM [Actinomycetota bacterium]